VPFRHGFPLDSPGDPKRQRRVIDTALAMIWDETLSPPALVDDLP
jgi:hypothetical protein